MKNIILCSDGTGNSGNKLNGTNVWRLYEAIDKSPSDEGDHRQIAYYDDGVGTQDWRVLKLVAGATGFGLERNVTTLYAYLIRNFEPGDRIYLFGFSRGAFTVRVLANLLFYCGIARPKAADGSPRHRYHISTPDILELATQAVAAYRKREFCNPYQGPPSEFRRQFGLFDQQNVCSMPGWFPIHFIGVWDTVEAYGLPIHELADAYYRLFPLRLKVDGQVTENDLHPLISHAYHALAIDDERHTFLPNLWIERTPFDSCSKSKIDGTDVCFDFGRGLDATQQAALQSLRDQQVVRQVWFAGMHSNVGGGYAQDDLSHVSLRWMMRAATQAGLEFNRDLCRDYAQAADPFGKMYDSRSGLGVYYRYHPRDLARLSAEAGIDKPIIHPSVFNRIWLRTQAYSPTGIPEQYEIDDEEDVPSERESDKTARLQIQTRADDFIWGGRVLYFGFALWTVALFLASWRLSFGDQSAPDVEKWDRATFGFYVLSQPLIDFATWLTPAYFKPGLVALSHHPRVTMAFLGLFGLVFLCFRYLMRQIRRLSGEAWMGTHPFDRQRASAPTNPLPRWGVAQVRDRIGVNHFANWFYRVIVPKGVFVLSLIVLAAILGRWMWPALVHKPDSGLASTTLTTLMSTQFDFDTRDALFATPVLVKAGGWYRIQVDEKPVDESGRGPWFDKTIPADADGLIATPAELEMLGFARRVPTENWFKVIAAIGPNDQNLIPIGKKALFVAKTSGRLYLFVNDAIGAYGNNRGTATVTVEAVLAPDSGTATMPGSN